MSVVVAAALVAAVGLGFAMGRRAPRPELAQAEDWRRAATTWRVAAEVWERNAQEAQGELELATILAAHLTNIVQYQDQVLVQFANPSMN